jgi:hypothetical protein
VLVGTEGYNGIKAIANQPGTDGTVAFSTANLQCGRLAIRFFPKGGRIQAPPPDVLPYGGMNGEVAYCRIPGLNHTDITLHNNPNPGQPLAAMILDALQVTPATFLAFANQLEAANQQAIQQAQSRYQHGISHVVFHVHDQHGTDVQDYLLEFYIMDEDGGVDEAQTRLLLEEVILGIHPYGANTSYRSVMLDLTAFAKLKLGAGNLYVSLTAQPELSATMTVGYETLAFQDIGELMLSASGGLQNWIKPDQTLLLDVEIQRLQNASCYTI